MKDDKLNNESGMRMAENKNRGFVYILEVKDIVLPICKIGMTTRNPHDRCNELNSSSTGDFIWEVSHYIAVDDCKALESLVHSKLSPLRQRRREFFNIHADDANTAMISIIDSQSEIKQIDVVLPPLKKRKKKKHKSGFKRIDSKYAELLGLFTSVLNIKGRPFGQLNKPSFGMSDGNDGVQWYLSVSPDTGVIRLGVNLEGMKYKHWPISKFILSEINNPKICEVAATLNNPNDVHIRFSRDAWQV